MCDSFVVRVGAVASSAGRGPRSLREPTPASPSRWAVSSSRAWTKAWGRLPRSWRWTTSYSSVNSPGGPQAARLRSNQRSAPATSPCWWAGQRHEEAAEHEGALGLVRAGGRPGGTGRRSRRRSSSSTTAREVATRARVVGGHGAADAGQQQRGVDARVVGGALPASGRGAGSRGRPSATSRSASGAHRRAPCPPAPALADGAQPGGAHQPGVGPAAVVELPDAGVGFGPALLDGRDERPRRRAGRSASSRPRPVGGGEQQQRLAERVELELLVDPVADPYRRRRGSRAARAWRSSGTGVAGRRCRPGAGLAPSVEHPVGDEPDRVVEQGVAADGGGGLAGVALVADPGVAVVVVAALVGALGQRGRGGGDHRAGGAGQPAQHGVGVAGRRRGPAGRSSVGHGARARPARCAATAASGSRQLARAGRRRRSPGPGRGGRPRARRGRARSRPSSSRACVGRAGPAVVQVAAVAVPDARPRCGARSSRRAPNSGAHVQSDRRRGRRRSVGLDAAQQHDAVAVAGEGQRLAALDDRRRSVTQRLRQIRRVLARSGRPTRTGRPRGDARSRRRRRAGWRTPRRRASAGAHSNAMSPRGSDQGAALAVGEQRVLAQHVRGELGHRRVGTHPRSHRNRCLCTTIACRRRGCQRRDTGTAQPAGRRTQEEGESSQ